MDFELFNMSRVGKIQIVSVILVIFAVSFYQLRIGEMKTRDVRRKDDAKLVIEALDEYMVEYGFVPPADAEGRIVSCGDKGRQVCVWGNDKILGLTNESYLDNLPKDPLESRRYMYVYDRVGNKYRVFAALENGGDPEIKTGLTEMCGENVQCNWYAGK